MQMLANFTYAGTFIFLFKKLTNWGTTLAHLLAPMNRPACSPWPSGARPEITPANILLYILPYF